MSVIKTSQLMLYREIIAVCSQIHTKHINTLCGQNVEFVNVTAGGTYSNFDGLRLFILPFRVILRTTTNYFPTQH